MGLEENEHESSHEGRSNVVTQVNATTGKNECVKLHEHYDYHVEVARSAFADMLHDDDRNVRYLNALRYEISRMHAEGLSVNVLDIGTGTGLLSMMACVAGADAVYACEAFTPMLNCARNVVKTNGFHEKIKLIQKRSNELVVGVDIPHKCNLLVTEVFDTELIGEWAISTFNHANLHLLTEDAVVIPNLANVYAQVVNCPEVEAWNSLPEELKLSNVDVQFPKGVSRCGGVPSCQDIQIDGIKDFTPLSPPLRVFQFDFTKKIEKDRAEKVKFSAETCGAANAVFLWWDLEMDRSGDNTLTCAPSYVCKGPESWFKEFKRQKPEWRDHWMQSVYYIPRRFQVSSNAVLYAAHDEYSFWFDVGGEGIEIPMSHPVCECGVHTVLSRTQVRMINDTGRYERMLKAVHNLQDSVFLCVSDCSLLGILLGKFGAKLVVVLERSNENQRVTKEILAANGLTNVRVIVKEAEDLKESDFDNSLVDMMIGDPYFHGATVPWNHLLFWYVKNSLDAKLLSSSFLCLPGRAMLRGCACRFTHLWKINAPVKTAVGLFNLSDFDKLIKESRSIADCPVDSQPLWEYETITTSEPFDILEFNFSVAPSRTKFSGEIDLKSWGTNGIAVWMEYSFNDTVTSTGPTNNPAPGDLVEWNKAFQQGVYFLETSRGKLSYTAEFNEAEGDVSFTFE